MSDMDIRVRKEIPVEKERRDWLKVPEAARYFGIPRSRMYDLIQKGELPAVRIGERSIRVNRREVEEFLTANRRIDPGAV
jgi:excisionase family DNA binding protein